MKPIHIIALALVLSAGDPIYAQAGKSETQAFASRQDPPLLLKLPFTRTASR